MAVFFWLRQSNCEKHNRNKLNIPCKIRRYNLYFAGNYFVVPLLWAFFQSFLLDDLRQLSLASPWKSTKNGIRI